MVVTSFTNDENARPPTLLKMESTTDTLIDQGHRFQNSYWKSVKGYYCFTKACILRACYEISWWYHPSKSTSIEAHWNTECFALCFQFPKFCLISVLHFLFYYADPCMDTKWKKTIKLLIDAVDYVNNGLQKKSTDNFQRRAS